MATTTVRDVMTKDPVAMSSDASVAEAAKAMSDLRIGTVVVMEQDKPCGIVTDRDITVRAVATGGDPSTILLADICTRDIAAVRPDQSVGDAIQLMKSRDIKRLVVMTDSKLEGIVSLGDLAARGEGRARETRRHVRCPRAPGLCHRLSQRPSRRWRVHRRSVHRGDFVERQIDLPRCQRHPTGRKLHSEKKVRILGG